MRRQSLLFTTLAATLVTAFTTPLRPAVVWGESMAPTLQSGGLYVLDTRYYRDHPVERDDIIVFHYGGQTCTKRVYAVPGDRLILLQYADGVGTEIVAPADLARLRRLQRKGRLVSRRLLQVIVPSGQYFVLGDNQPVSWDSRSFGFLPKEAIVGRLAL